MKKTTSLRHSLAAVVTAVSIGLFGIGSLTVAEAQAAGVETSTYAIVDQVALPASTVRDE